MESKYNLPTPGIENIRSIIKDPLKTKTNSLKIIGKIGTIAFRNAWRIVACLRVRPFVLANSINSLVRTSVSSARVNLAYPAIELKHRENTAGSIDLNIGQEK